ncbi:4466_t:CDS:1, partial [Gigaspora margarita]
KLEEGTNLSHSKKTRMGLYAKLGVPNSLTRNFLEMCHKDPNQRLTKILEKKKILRGPNFAGLPGESILEPIHLLNNLTEVAKEQKKELW